MAPSRVFMIALMVSTLFHLSMVSVFSIVIRFPSRGLAYCTLDIVHEPATELARVVPRDMLRTTAPERLLEQSEAELYGVDAADTLPAVELPRLEIAATGPFSNREESAKIRSRFGDLFEQRPPEAPDSWAVFTRELRDIGPTLSRLTFAPEAKEEKTPKVLISRTGAGIDIAVEWMSEPKNRKALYSPPMGALWGVDPTQLDPNGPNGPIMLMFTVSPEGKVTEVQTSIEDDAGVVAQVKKGLTRYLFEPLNGKDAKEQRGTLYVMPEPSIE